jgi:hypothetical protein
MLRFFFMMSVTAAFAATGSALLIAAPVEWTTTSGGNGHRYEIEMQPMPWDMAKLEAERRGGYLATITSQAEYDFAMTLLRGQDGQLNPRYWGLGQGARRFGPWIGAYQSPNQPDSRSGWNWVTSEPFQYTAWFPTEPNDYNGQREEVAVFFVNPAVSTTPGWNDDVRQNIHPFIVEFNPQGATPAVVAPPVIPPVAPSREVDVQSTMSPSSSAPIASAAPRSGSSLRKTLGIVVFVLGLVGAPIVGVVVYFTTKIAILSKSKAVSKRA